MITLLYLVLALQSPIEDGIKALDAGKPAEAEALFLKAVAADPKDFSSYFNLAFAQSMQWLPTAACTRHSEHAGLPQRVQRRQARSRQRKDNLPARSVEPE